MPTKEKPAIPLEQFKAGLVSVCDIDWARLAAFIDGEGSIVIYRALPIGRQKSITYALTVSITNSSPVLISWLNETFGGSVHDKPPRVENPLSKRPMWSWHLQEQQAGIVLQNCLPYFIIKRQQAEIGIAFSELKAATAPKPFTRVSESSLKKREELRNKIHLLNSPRSAERVG